jgi:hypothetical protein
MRTGISKNAFTTMPSNGKAWNRFGSWIRSARKVGYLPGLSVIPRAYISLHTFDAASVLHRAARRAEDTITVGSGQMTPYRCYTASKWSDPIGSISRGEGSPCSRKKRTRS